MLSVFDKKCGVQKWTKDKQIKNISDFKYYFNYLYLKIYAHNMYYKIFVFYIFKSLITDRQNNMIFWLFKTKYLIDLNSYYLVYELKTKDSDVFVCEVLKQSTYNKPRIKRSNIFREDIKIYNPYTVYLTS